jgi:predicted RNase H-like nuclease (RuvC/YqgF family)
MYTIQELDKECLESAIEALIFYTNESKKLEGKISYKKSEIEQYANENGVIYSDSSHSVSLVYAPKVEWQDEELDELELEIQDYEQQIEALKYKQQQAKDKKKSRISELQSEIKTYCIAQDKGVNEVWSEFACIKSLENKFQVRISKSKVNKETGKQESDFERSWIYKK